MDTWIYHPVEIVKYEMIVNKETFKIKEMI